MWQMLSLCALVGAALAKAPVGLPDARAIVARVQKYYDTINASMADFKQTYTNTVFGKSSESHGHVMVKKPGKMRWDYAKPAVKYIISDGETLWVYEQEDRQAFKESLKDQVLPVAVTFLYGQGNLADEFDVSLDSGSYGAKTDHVLKLVPKKPSAQYKHLWLVVDPDDFHVKESIILEASDNTNQFKFYNVKTNAQAKVDDKLFKFKPPAGVKVIRPEK